MSADPERAAATRRRSSGQGPAILWRADDADVLVARIASLGLAVGRSKAAPPEMPSDTEEDEWVVRLSSATLVVRRGSRSAAGVVLLEAPNPWSPGNGGDPAGSGPEVAELVAIGWATVDLDRAGVRGITHGRPARGRPRMPPASLPPDVALGARAARLLGGGPSIVLLEPEREGRLAASLARFGEGPSVLYLRLPPPPGSPSDDGRDSRARALRPAADGPFGRERLLSGRPAWGPHVVAVVGDRHGGPPRDRDRVPSRP